MIVVLFGQPHSGKTTLANNLRGLWSDGESSLQNWIDGDGVRSIFKNHDFSKEGRIANLNRISDIATFLNYTQGDVIVSAIYPYLEARNYLNSLNPDDVAWIYLHYHEIRGREKYHVTDFDLPIESNDDFLSLNTSVDGIATCAIKIDEFLKAKRARRTENFINLLSSINGESKP
jgi:GTPase SAR1 family protein